MANPPDLPQHDPSHNENSTEGPSQLPLFGDERQPAKLPDRKPPGMSWTSFADAKIREAQQAGQFDNLPGFGKPLPGMDKPDDENWWVKQQLRKEGLSLLPPALEIKLDVEKTLDRLANMSYEADVRRTIAELNLRILAAQRASWWGPPCDTQPLDEQATIDRWQQARDATQADASKSDQ